MIRGVDDGPDGLNDAAFDRALRPSRARKASSGLTAEQFRSLCDAVDERRSSVESALSHERPAEAERLYNAVRELHDARLARANKALEHRREAVIDRAMLVHARHGAPVDSATAGGVQ